MIADRFSCSSKTVTDSGVTRITAGIANSAENSPRNWMRGDYVIENPCRHCYRLFLRLTGSCAPGLEQEHIFPANHRDELRIGVRPWSRLGCARSGSVPPLRKLIEAGA